MRQPKYGKWIAIAALVVAASCTVPTVQGGKNPAGSLDLTKPGAVIKNLTFGKVNLPKSLQDGSTNSAARSARPVGKVAGDVTQLTSLTLPSLKAEGYQDFKETVSRASLISVFLGALKTVPAVDNNTLAINQTVDTDTIGISMGGPFAINLSHSGRVRTSLSNDGNTLKIYWSLRWPDSAQMEEPTVDPSDPSYPAAYSAAFSACPRIVLNLYIAVDKSGSAECYTYRANDGPGGVGGHFMNYWSKFDPSTGTSLEAEEAQWGDSVDTSVTAVVPQGSSYSIYKKYEGDGYKEETLAYADDSFGGLASLGVDEYDDGSGFSEHPYIDVEYYDGTGDLVYQGWGDSAANVNNWSWLSSYSGSHNLYDYNVSGSHSKPSTFRVMAVWDGTTSTETYQISLDGGNSWAPMTGYEGGYLVFHKPGSYDASSSSWVFQPGDAVYWMSSWIAGPDNNTSYRDYYKGYEVPEGENYFGETYYVSKNYPLKNLLPLKAQYASGYVVTQLEGPTEYFWDTEDGDSHTGETPPDEGEYTYLSHWTRYVYWLENKNYVNPDTGLKDNDPQVNDGGDKGDVTLQLNDLTVYKWDQTLQQEVESRSPAFSTYQSDLPPYFALSQSKLDSVAATKAKLQSLYSNRDQYSAAVYLADYSSRFGPLLADFPSLDDYED